VSGNLWGLGFSWAGRVLFAQFKVTLILLVVVLLGVGIDSVNFHLKSENINVTFREDLITCQVVVSDEGLSRLLDLVVIGELLSAEEAGERIVTVVLMVGLTHFNGIVSEVIVDYERTILSSAVET